MNSIFCNSLSGDIGVTQENTTSNKKIRKKRLLRKNPLQDKATKFMIYNGVYDLYKALQFMIYNGVSSLLTLPNHTINTNKY